MVVIYGKGPSAKALARGLDGLWHSSESNSLRKWTEHGRGRGSWIKHRPPLGRSQRVVNYGHIHPHSAERPTLTLNDHIVHNKYRQLERMAQAGVPVPRFQRTTPTQPGWLCRADQHQRGTDIRQGTETLRRRRQEVQCACRECGNTHTKMAETATPEVTYPRADYYVVYHQKEREFRCHVINGASVRMCEKILQEDEGAVIWNSDNSHFSFAEIHPRAVRQAIRSVAKAAVEALGQDFGAVDIMLHRGEAIVLEVNSAPSLTDNDNTLERYVDHIRRWANG